MKLTIEKIEAAFHKLGPSTTRAIAAHFGIDSAAASKSLSRWSRLGLLTFTEGLPRIWSLSGKGQVVKTLKARTRPDCDAYPSPERIAEMERIKAEIHREKLAQGPPNTCTDYGRPGIRVVSTRMLPSGAGKIIGK